MIYIRTATPQDVPLIHQLAHETWWDTYRGILSAGQISFMLNDMYSEASLEAQLQEISFLVAERDGTPVAFAGYSLTEPENGVYKLHKIYLLPSEQGKGTGKLLIGYVEEAVKTAGGKILELNVNRANPALGFYQRLGFEIEKEVDIPYFEYFLNDYVMRKELMANS